MELSQHSLASPSLSAPSALDSVPLAFCSLKITLPHAQDSSLLLLHPTHTRSWCQDLSYVYHSADWVDHDSMAPPAYLPEEEATSLPKALPFVRIYSRPLLKQAKNMPSIICLQWILSPAKTQPWQQLAVYFCEVAAKEKQWRGWEGSSVSKVLVVQASGPEFDPRHVYNINWAWQC